MVGELYAKKYIMDLERILLGDWVVDCPCWPAAKTCEGEAPAWNQVVTPTAPISANGFFSSSVFKE